MIIRRVIGQNILIDEIRGGVQNPCGKLRIHGPVLTGENEIAVLVGLRGPCAPVPPGHSDGGNLIRLQIDDCASAILTDRKGFLPAAVQEEKTGRAQGRENGKKQHPQAGTPAGIAVLFSFNLLHAWRPPFIRLGGRRSGVIRDSIRDSSYSRGEGLSRALDANVPD